MKVGRGQAVAVAQTNKAVRCTVYSEHTEINGCLLVLALAAGSGCSET